MVSLMKIFRIRKKFQNDFGILNENNSNLDKILKLQRYSKARNRTLQIRRRPRFRPEIVAEVLDFQSKWLWYP